MSAKANDLFLNFGILSLAIAVGWVIARGSDRIAATDNPGRVSMISDWKPLFPGRRAVGSPDGPVRTILFTDYQCPWCRSLFPVLAQLRGTYPAKVGVSIRHFPNMALHSSARQAALAAECAADQDRLERIEPLLYAEGPLPALDSLASGSEVSDTGRFITCVTDESHASDVDADLMLGRRLGITATPTLIVNGQVLVGFRSFVELDSVGQGLLGAVK